MFLGMEWYWWIVIIVVIGISVPFKLKFMKRLDRRRREKKENSWGKRGEGK